MSAKFIIKSTFLVLVAALAIVLSACGGGSPGDGYTVVSPIVNPGETLTGSDFIMTSAFADSDYTVTIDTPVPTDEPGSHEATVTVTDGRGYERTHTCTYTVRSYLRDSVRIEIGTPVTVDKFINTDIESYRDRTFAFQDERLVASYGLGTYRIGILVDDVLQYSSLILEDTIPPTASPVTVHITALTGVPRAEDFVADIKDATSVACTFKENYNFETTDDIYVTIVLTDEAGNVTEIEAFATCAVDTTPPEIHGVHDITVFVGDTIKYREGITVTDDSGEVPSLSVDNTRVNPNVAGMYEITYSAKDSSGNETIVRATVNVIERPKVDEGVMKAMARDIYNKEIHTKSDMSKWDIAYAIYRWTHDSITYVNDKVDKNDPIGAAYDGMNNRRGDCFTYMAVARELLEVAGIDCRQITRLQHEGESSHYWLLVDIGQGWYHFDACWQFKSKPFESFMRTDAELEAYCAMYDNFEYYYRFDKSKYPARGTVSYYDEAGNAIPPEA